MDLKTLLTSAHKLLGEAGIDHALIGGIAMGALGIQRFTNDVDFLVDGTHRLKVKEIFYQRGYSVFFESPDVMQLEGPGMVDFLFANRELSRQMLSRAKELPGFGIKCLGVEDIIGLKIQAYCNSPKREFKDKADIQALIDKYADSGLNWETIKLYADIFNQWDEIKAIKEKAGRDDKIVL